MASEDGFRAAKILKLIRTKKEKFWLRIREKQALKLFHEAARRVPAYRDFLKRNGVKPPKIKTFKDFESLPITSKADYLRKYPLEKLSWDGTLKKPLVFTSTSGSTGEPFYFPRGERLDWEYSVMAEMFLENSSYHSGGPVLVIIGFGMGVWIGGLITYKAFEIAGQRDHLPLSIITPGINKPEILKALQNLSPHYKETVFIAYPPFMKDVIDEAKSAGINLKKFNIRLFSAAEAYTEKFRDYIVRKAGVKNPYLDTLNIYGTADIGAMAWETPTTILIRRLALENKKLFNELFHTIKTPTLTQYNPYFVTFESVNGEILLTGNNTIPLIRYAVGDNGSTITMSVVREKFKEFGIDLYKEAHKAGIHGHLYELPLVAVYERSDFAVKLHLRDIYPEIIRDVLISKKLSKILTGKFTMITKYDQRQDQYLELNLEIRKGKKTSPRFKKLVQKQLLRALHLKTEGPGTPDIFLKNPNIIKPIFWRAEHPLHFKPGIKQKWVKK